MKLSPRIIAGYGLAKLAPGLITVVAIPVTVAFIGSAGYGVYSSTWALTLLASSLCGGWLRAAALRATGDPGSALGRLPRRILLLTSIAPAVPAAAWTASLSAQHPGLGSTGLVVAGALFAAANGGYALITTRTQRDGGAGRFAVAETVRALVGVAATLGLVVAHLSGGATAALTGYTIGTVLAGAIAAGPTWPPLTHGAPQAGLLAVYWRYGWPMSLWLGASTALVYADRFVVTQLLGPSVAGRYAAVADLVVRGTAIATSPVIMAVHPVLMAHWNAGRIEPALLLLRRTAQAMAALLGAAVLGVALLGPVLLNLILPGSGLSRPLLAGLALGSAMWQLGIIAHKPFELVARNVRMLVIATVAMAATVGLDLLLVPLIGLSGAVLALCAGATGYTIVCAGSGVRLLRTHLAAGEPTLTLAGVR